MCTANASNNHQSSISNVLSAFIQGDYLVDSISATEKQHFPHYFFVNYAKENCVLLVLIGGCCLFCHSLLFRDVCLIQYCNDVVKPVIKKSPMVSDIMCVHTTDPHFSNVVEKNNCVICILDFETQ